ncbi:MAG TPA: hypothetical protein VMB50_14615 [Myxococcales bacterium]|nr:hypothetical protein [Myxococcales bacterium]
MSLLRRLAVETLAVAIVTTFPPPVAFAGPSRPLLAQAYPPPPPDVPLRLAEPPPKGAWGPPGPPGHVAEQTARGEHDGRADAMRQVDATFWFFVGFLLSLPGLVVGAVWPVSPDAARLIGQPPAYVQAYTTAYRSATHGHRDLPALLGCLISGGIAAFVAIILASPAA